MSASKPSILNKPVSLEVVPFIRFEFSTSETMIFEYAIGWFLSSSTTPETENSCAILEIGRKAQLKIIAIFLIIFKSEILKQQYTISFALSITVKPYYRRTVLF